MNRRKVASIGGIAAAILILSSCGKEISPEGTDAGKVNGTDGLYRFCDGSTLIYFTDISGSDDIVEAVWPGLCVKTEGGWTYDASAVTEPQKNGNGPDDGK